MSRTRLWVHKLLTRMLISTQISHLFLICRSRTVLKLAMCLIGNTTPSSSEIVLLGWRWLRSLLGCVFSTCRHLRQWWRLCGRDTRVAGNFSRDVVTNGGSRAHHCIWSVNETGCLPEADVSGQLWWIVDNVLATPPVIGFCHWIRYSQ